MNLGGYNYNQHKSTPSPRVKHKGHPKVGMDIAIAQLVPTREAARVGMDIANAKPVPTSGAVTWEYSR